MPLPEGRWPAPVKINLFLHITAGSAGQYHDIQSLFRLLDYCDYLEISATRSPLIDFACSDSSIAESDNLALLAAKLLKKRCKVSAGAKIYLRKKVPVGSGLGAGSSNAATVLRVLNKLWRCGCEQKALEDLGFELGADVPFFVRGVDAWVEGKGERLMQIDLPPAYYAVFVPKVSVLSKAMYAAADLERKQAPITEKMFHEGKAKNVFEHIVRRRYPLVGQAMDWLGNFAKAQLSGSGSAVFASFKNKSEAREVWRSRPAGLFGFVAKSSGVSPLLHVLENAKL